MKKTFSIHVCGNRKQWSFNFEADDKYWQDWLDDGLEVYEIVSLNEETWIDNDGRPITIGLN